MKYKIIGLSLEKANELAIFPIKEVYRKLTREGHIKEYKKWQDYYDKNKRQKPSILDRYESGGDYFDYIKQNCNRDKKFYDIYDIFDDYIIQYEYNYYFNINSYEDLEYLQNIIGGFYISIKNAFIDLSEL